jgi:phosphoribosylamine--glycine ligase
MPENGVKLIEYNARFGDPEAINLLALLDTDFIDICYGIIEQNLINITAKFLSKATVCKYIVPKGYPDKPVVDKKIDFIPQENIYFASVNAKDGKIYTTSSRALAVLGVADTIVEAEQQAEAMAQQIKGEVFYREDIGK